MLLAAGRSTRLGALGLALPKPLIPVCGYPAIRFGLHAAARAGARRVVVNVFHRGDLVQSTLGERVGSDGGRLSIDVAYSVETELLGTGGGLAKARAQFDAGPLLVMNAKVVADLDLGALRAAHGRAGGVATMLLRDDPEPRRWGAIGVDETGRVVSILDARSPQPPRGAVTERMFTGIHVLEPALLDRLQPVVCDVIRDAYIPALLAGETISAITHAGYFAEHSTPERYLAGNVALLRDPGLLRDPPGPLVGVDAAAAIDGAARVVGSCRIEAQAVIEPGAVVGPEVVVGAGARVAAGARLERTVVWPGAVASGTIADAIVTPNGLVGV
jgi:NDP-sugar pyrophosphorylase family protein